MGTIFVVAAIGGVWLGLGVVTVAMLNVAKRLVAAASVSSRHRTASPLSAPLPRPTGARRLPPLPAPDASTALSG